MPDTTTPTVRPDWAAGARVAAPRDTAETAEVMRAAAEERALVVARGHGTKLDWGAPPRGCDLIVDTTGIADIEHTAGDLVARVGAGADLAGMQRVLAEHGQRLSVDPPVPGSTVGGVLATGLSGPSRLLHGPVRDLVIGMTVVYADGRTANSGGRVVKNVAGYDLGKLHTGALGSLGVITSATFRLHPLPEAHRVVRARTAERAAAEAWLRGVRDSQTAPAAVEIDLSPEKDGIDVQILVEGAAGGIDRRAADLAALLGGGSVAAETPEGWGLLPGGAADTLLKAVVPVSHAVAAAAALRAAAEAAGAPARVRGSAGAGVLHAALPGGADPDAVLRIIAGLRIDLAGVGGTLTVPRPAEPVRSAGVDVWGEVPGLPLMRTVKTRLDPGHRLAPGRFVGGI